MIKKALRRIPGLVPVYHQACFLGRIVHEGWWVDQNRFYDEAHQRRDWDFGSPLVRDRNRRLLAAVGRYVGSEPWGSALEIGCAEGIFTCELAPHCASVTATDISAIACENAARRCAAIGNVTVKQLNLLRDPIPGAYDLVFAMDVFDCLHGRSRIERVAAACAGALRPGGLLAFTGCRLPSPLRAYPVPRWLREGADNLVAFLHGRFGLTLVHREIHPDDEQDRPDYPVHVIALFRREG